VGVAGECVFIDLAWKSAVSGFRLSRSVVVDELHSEI
jgi:hypothetical protein